MTNVVNVFMVYQFLKRLVTPFNKWKAYETGVIDAEGKVLVKKDDRDKAQAESWLAFDRLVANLKKLLGKVPGGKTRLATFAAALLLIKESETVDPDDLNYLEEALEFYMTEAQVLMEEVPTVAAQTGEVAGLGVGDKGEPGIDNKKKNNKKLAMMMRRKMNV